MVQPLQRTAWRFLKKKKKEIKEKLSYDPVIPFMGTHPERNMIQKDPCIPMFNVALFTVAKTWK